MENSDQHQIEITVTERRGNYFSAVMFLAALVLYGVAFALVWGWNLLVDAFHNFLTEYVMLFTTVIIGMILHEALHGLTWAFYCKNGIHSIRYGVKWQALAPYAHCNEKLTIRAYRIGGIMPGVVLGVLPGLISILIGNGWLLVFATFFTAGAAGDFLILWKLRPYRSTCVVQDHPEKIGCIVYES